MKFFFYITKDAVEEMEALEYEAFERAQDGEFRLYRIRPAIARFMVDENDKPIPYAIALKQSERMKLKDVKQFVNSFFETMKDSTIPKENAKPSNSPLEVPSVVSAFPIG